MIGLACALGSMVGALLILPVMRPIVESPMGSGAGG